MTVDGGFVKNTGNFGTSAPTTDCDSATWSA
jgi:hypothetical protein